MYKQFRYNTSKHGLNIINRWINHVFYWADKLGNNKFLTLEQVDWMATHINQHSYA